jgi:hypothetical protein
VFVSLDPEDHREQAHVIQARLLNLSRKGVKLSVPAELPLPEPGGFREAEEPLSNADDAATRRMSRWCPTALISSMLKRSSQGGASSGDAHNLRFY